jgi:putative ABC transport system permease protein
MLGSFTLIFRNALRNRRRSALTIASIAVSICLLGVLLAIYRTLFAPAQTTPAQALRVFVVHKVSMVQALPLSHGAAIRNVAGVKAAMLWQFFGGTYGDSNDPRNFFPRLAIEPSKLFDVFSEFTISHDERSAFEHERTAAVASQAVANKYGWRPGQKITFVGDIFPVNLDLTLVGIFADSENREWVFFNHEYLRESLPVGDASRDSIQAFVVQAANPDDVTRISQAIDRQFANSPYPTVSKTERAFQLSFVGFLGNLRLFLAAICGAVTFTMLLVSGNTLSMSVRERIREMAVLKTVGYPPREILGVILGEAAVTSLTGGVIGCVLAYFLCGAVRSAPGAGNWFSNLTLSPGVATIALLVAVSIGVVSALVPAISASRLSIVDSLRYEG